MLTKINLAGEWKLLIDEEHTGYTLPESYNDVIDLPGTTSHARKGPKNDNKLIGALTDEYLFEGQVWYAKEVEIPELPEGGNTLLYLERTRMTKVWLDGEELGSRNSLNTAHIYDLTGKLQAGRHTLTVRVDNTGYPTKGGHLTSPDTQTNWNGITGRMEIQIYGAAYLSDIRLDPELAERSVMISAALNGTGAASVTVSAESFNGETVHQAEERSYAVIPGALNVRYALGEDALLWSEAAPNLYKIRLTVKDAEGQETDRQEVIFGLREFGAAGDKFTINGAKTFLRGKHDGLIFPLTGYAPTDVEEWVRILGISKAYGMNHYRFHTCCPPEAAFTAADMLGIYMQPELPFWGTITTEADENHNQAEQDYLISEGYAILKAFGNHPSFVMMSLGNELWGSREKIDAILKEYKEFDSRHLYTQGSNNHQFMPEILEHDDFFSGVRFSRDRLFRGSYAMCDAPLGHVQTDLPGTMKDYDDQIVPPDFRNASDAELSSGATIQIQYGTEAKTVQVGDGSGEWIPQIPVVSHEIGQYATFPDFEEIVKYSGSLKAHNFEVFRERLESKGLGHLAKAYFENSGQLAMDCYKEELEAAFRSRRLAGFQLLDLQDFSGQGTALVGVLDAFMDSKGLITPEDWRTFCGDAVVMARFPKFNYASGERFEASAELAWYRAESPEFFHLHWALKTEQGILAEGAAKAGASGEANYFDFGAITALLPEVEVMRKAVLSLWIEGTDVRKTYDLWIYPQQNKDPLSGVRVFDELSDDALELLRQGENVLLMPKPESLENAIEGFYCTDFWCYPMFRSISESMNRPVPVGTMGLLIDNVHPVLRGFQSETHSTYPWWNLVENSKSIIMDDTANDWSPIVQTIDNFERNHKLGFLFECRVGAGKLLVCPLDFRKVQDTLEGRQFLSSIAAYMASDEFNPQHESNGEELRQLIH
ncbi:glycoside hydrolase family 2 TIM barrel-domain containing protein [Paenibacillus sp. NFR01]|uniref:glycoside hydrolase family 2 TIM barrel-domain containing protein n=1 Tax=Paenibacillus sp. NFR01 TaxID=1566279 RepID=UPI0008C91554|nr:glycoside hydrolase family 2 TIM barrel-domain containing protein [Paenibacillus sp. NFR01]SET20806.1 Glycosyl hydrolases family 2, TIM barrel domain [Paenibacillus sp. NFR01]